MESLEKVECELSHQEQRQLEKKEQTRRKRELLKEEREKKRVQLQQRRAEPKAPVVKDACSIKNNR